MEEEKQLLLNIEKPTYNDYLDPSNNIDYAEEGEDEKQQQLHSYGNIFGYAISINYVIGTGVFAVPNAIVESGLLLSAICVIGFGSIAIICANWVLEFLARSEGVHTAQEIDSPTLENKIVIGRKFDFTSVFLIFTGPWGQWICQLVMALYVYGVMWAFAAVFASSAVSIFFEFALDKHCDIYDHPSFWCHFGYYVALAIFAAIVIPMSLVDMTEQAWVQLSMTVYRFSAFAVMIITCTVGLFDSHNPHTRADHGPSNLAYDRAVDWTGFGQIFTTAAVALTIHYNLPDIVTPIRTKNKTHWVVCSALTTTIIFYLGVGILCALYFGYKAEPLITLNWKSYTGTDYGWGHHKVWWAYIVQLWIMLFPIFDMVSVYPIVGITLGDNLTAITPQVIKKKVFRNHDKIHKLSMRLLATVPSIILAAALGKLNKIFDFTGLCAFFLSIIFPSILQIISTRYCEKFYGKDASKTPYSNFFSHPVFAYIIATIGGLAFIFSLINFFAPNLFKKF